MRALWRRQYYQNFYFLLQLAATEMTTYHEMKFISKLFCSNIALNSIKGICFSFRKCGEKRENLRLYNVHGMCVKTRPLSVPIRTSGIPQSSRLDQWKPKMWVRTSVTYCESGIGKELGRKRQERVITSANVEILSQRGGEGSDPIPTFSNQNH